MKNFNFVSTKIMNGQNINKQYSINNKQFNKQGSKGNVEEAVLKKKRGVILNLFQNLPRTARPSSTTALQTLKKVQGD